MGWSTYDVGGMLVIVTGLCICTPKSVAWIVQEIRRNRDIRTIHHPASIRSYVVPRPQLPPPYDWSNSAADENTESSSLAD